MKRRSPVCLLVFLVATCLDAGLAFAQSAAEDGRHPRPEFSRTRRVGHLERDAQAPGEYRLRDVWDQRTYRVLAGKGLDLAPFADRYVSLHGTTRGDSGRPEFRVEKVIDLDRRRGREPRPAVAYSTQQVDFEEILPVQNLEIQMPSEALEPGVLVDPVPMTEMIEVPAADGEFFGPISGGDASLLEPIPAGVNPGFASAEAVWVRAEYLWWWTDGMQLPPLVTSSPAGTPRTAAGVLGVPGTFLLTPVSVNNDLHSGLRLRGGTWLGGLGVGGDYYGLNHQVSRFSASSTGSPILARPFFDALNGRETAELVAFPGVIGGTVSTEARTEFQSAGAHLMFNLCGDWSFDGCFYSGSRINGLIGYRHARLGDNLSVNEDLTSQDAQNPGRFVIQDLFGTTNGFHGAEVGVQYQRRAGRLMIEALTKLALGNNRQVVNIAGSTRLITGGLDLTEQGGLLAQRTNIGRHVRDEFAVLPEIGLTFGYQVTPSLTVTLGYTLVYLSNVVRAGDQVDLDVNPNLLPPEAVPFVGPARPRFAFRETDFWAQGMSIGGEFRW